MRKKQPSDMIDSVYKMNAQLLKRLKAQVEKHGRLKIAMDLGYKSESTMNKWFTSGVIPALARDKVRAYLKGKKS